MSRLKLDKFGVNTMTNETNKIDPAAQLGGRIEPVVSVDIDDYALDVSVMPEAHVISQFEDMRDEAKDQWQECVGKNPHEEYQWLFRYSLAKMLVDSCEH